jgi:catechol-2,3-dioxygenase
MLNHIGINVSDLSRSRHFYDAVLAELGCIGKTASSTFASYGVPTIDNTMTLVVISGFQKANHQFRECILHSLH